MAVGNQLGDYCRNPGVNYRAQFWGALGRSVWEMELQA